MSRSYKKNKIVKDKPTRGKRIGNKLFRRKSKLDVKSDKEILLIDKSEVINDYDVSDYRMIGMGAKLKGKKQRHIK